MAKILSQRTEKWGIDVDVEFDVQGITYTTTMRFNSEEQITNELQERVDKQVIAITNELNEA